MSPTTDAAQDHAEALTRLEAGQPLTALQIWRDQLCRDAPSVQALLDAASATLAADAIAPIRRQAIQLAHLLLSHNPGEHEIQRLGVLLRDWGTVALPEVPSRALQHLERAWSCVNDSRLNDQLASLYARLGYGQGCRWLATPAQPLEPWPRQPCDGQACSRCQQLPAPADPLLGLHGLQNGTLALQRRRNPWGHSHGVAVLNARGEVQNALSRHYPWPWPGCDHPTIFEKTCRDQLNAALRARPSPPKAEGPVLAIAELSGEMFFHWQLELLPRLGRIWAQALQQWPNLRLWHNGGNHAYVREGLRRLGIPVERQLPPSEQIQADLLLVPDFASHFGRPATANLIWLEQFWASAGREPAARSTAPSPNQALWLGRSQAVRRAVIGEAQWIEQLKASPLPQGSLGEQLLQVAGATTIVAPHGAAMSNLIAAPAGSQVVELVNPAYQPTYFDGLIRHRRLQHQRLAGAVTPHPLQEWLYEGPLAFPIDLRPEASAAGRTLATWTP